MIQHAEKERFINSIFFYCTALALISIAITRWLMLPIAIFLFVFILIKNEWKSYFTLFTKEKLWIPFICIVGMFGVSVIGTLYSTNIQRGISDWEFKLWFIASPIFLFPFIKQWDRHRYNTLLILFCFSVLMLSIANIILSLIDYIETHEAGSFFYANATHFPIRHTHPSYLSAFLSVAWCVACMLLWHKEVKQRIQRSILIGALIILPIDIFLLQSKAGLIAFALCFIIALGIITFHKKRLFVSILLLTVIAGIGCYYIVRYTAIPFDRISRSINDFQKDDIHNPKNGTLQRIVIWEISWEEAIHALPWGVGTGDGQMTLDAAYQQKGYTHILQSHLNCHCQYLQSFLNGGILGIVAWLSFLGFLFVASIKRKDELLFFMVLIVAINSCTESFVESQAGSNFVPLMSTLLYLRARTMLSLNTLP